MRKRNQRDRGELCGAGCPALVSGLSGEKDSPGWASGWFHGSCLFLPLLSWLVLCDLVRSHVTCKPPCIRVMAPQLHVGGHMWLPALCLPGWAAHPTETTGLLGAAAHPRLTESL